MQKNSGGFTLIELSIVLVIIGLIAGGVLVGQTLIRSAEVRATISQIEKFNTAVNTFYGKYQGLPGDMNIGTAAQYGFTPRDPSGCGGCGDGNGVIEGEVCTGGGSCTMPTIESQGETAMFWVDLTYANGMNINLIDGGFSKGGFSPPSGNISATLLNLYLPAAKIGGGNYIYVYGVDGYNYFGLSAVTDFNDFANNCSCIASSALLTVQTAYTIDAKMDDGLPQTGRVTAQYANSAIRLALPAWVGGDNGPLDKTTASPPSPSTCYDDGGSTGSTRKYSLTTNSGAGGNCALSFRFQ